MLKKWFQSFTLSSVLWFKKNNLLRLDFIHLLYHHLSELFGFPGFFSTFYTLTPKAQQARAIRTCKVCPFDFCLSHSTCTLPFLAARLLYTLQNADWPDSLSYIEMLLKLNITFWMTVGYLHLCLVQLLQTMGKEHTFISESSGFWELQCTCRGPVFWFTEIIFPWWKECRVSLGNFSHDPIISQRLHLLISSPWKLCFQIWAGKMSR